MKINFTPPDMIFVFIGLQILTHFIIPVKQLFIYPFTLIGLLLIIMGQVPNFWSYFYFRKIQTTLKIYKIPEKLITSGFFRLSRNPIYLGMAITLFGISFLLGSLITFVFPIIFIILTDIFTINFEENNLKRKFGKRYINYTKKVRRWI